MLTSPPSIPDAPTLAGGAAVELPTVPPHIAAGVAAPDRLAALARTGLIDAAPDPAFEAICRLAVRMTGAPLALVSFVGHDRQVHQGMAGPAAPAPGSLDGARAYTYCQHVVAHGAPVVVGDTAQLPPELAAAAAGRIRAYLGVPIPGPDGHVLGSLCAVDVAPRTWTDADQEALTELVPLVTRAIAFHGATARLSQEARARADAQALTATAIDALDEAFLVLGLDGRLRQWNAGLRTTTGLDDDALAGLDVAALAAPADANRLREAVATAIADGAATVQVTVLSAGGRPTPHELSLSRILDGVGEVVGVCATGRDVSTRLAAETALRLNEARYRGLVEATPDLLLRLSREGRYLDVRAPDPAHLVLAPDRVVGATLQESIPEPLATTLLATIGQALDTGQWQQIEYALVPSGGEERRYEARLVPVGDDEVQAVIRDVTDRHEAARALREREVRFRSFVEATTQVVWMADPSGEVTELSAAWAEFTGQTPDEIAGWGWTAAVHPDDLERVVEGWNAALEARCLYEVEYRVRSREGAYHWFSVRAVPVEDEGAFLGWVGTCSDVEAARRHEAELVEAARVAERGRAEAEEAARMKSALLANVSHEIRTPLTSILGFADLLAEEADGSPDCDRSAYAALIGRAGRRLLETLTSVLDLAQIEAGRRELHLARLDARELVTETADLLRPHAEAKGLSLRCATPAAAIPVDADAGALSRILTNLLGNAVKFTEAGEVRVALAVEAGAAVLRVSDTGVGMSAAFLPVVFEEFRQESEGDARRFEGSGLGLAITRRLVEMLGGTIAVESALGAGSTFTVRLPLAAEPGATAA